MKGILAIITMRPDRAKLLCRHSFYTTVINVYHCATICVVIGNFVSPNDIVLCVHWGLADGCVS